MRNPFKVISISLIPNFRKKEIFLALSLLIRPWLYFNKTPQNLLKKELQKYLGKKYVFLFDSGRSALYFLLKGLGVQSGDEIIIQAFTCSVVPGAILAASATPVYGDIEETYNLDPRKLSQIISKKTKAVIIQHTFGTPADIGHIRKICEDHGLFLIEDCAHGLGNTFEGKKLGTFSDTAFFSFGRDKVISGVWGGAIATDNSVLAGNLQKLTEDLPERSFFWTLKQLSYPPLVYVIINTYSFFRLGKILHFLLRRTGVLSEALSAEEKKAIKPKTFYKSLSSPLCLLVLAQLQNLKQFIEERKSLAQYYAEHLGTKFEPGSSYLRYALEIDNPAELRKIAALQNIFLGNWYDEVIAPKGSDLEKFGYQKGSCPRAERAAEKILNLPTNPNLGLQEAQRVVNLFKAWRSKK